MDCKNCSLGHKCNGVSFYSKCNAMCSQTNELIFGNVSYFIMVSMYFVMFPSKRSVSAIR